MGQSTWDHAKHCFLGSALRGRISHFRRPCNSQLQRHPQVILRRESRLIQSPYPEQLLVKWLLSTSFSMVSFCLGTYCEGNIVWDNIRSTSATSLRESRTFSKVLQVTWVRKSMSCKGRDWLLPFDEKIMAPWNRKQPMSSSFKEVGLRFFKRIK